MLEPAPPVRWLGDLASGHPQAGRGGSLALLVCVPAEVGSGQVLSCYASQSRGWKRIPHWHKLSRSQGCGHRHRHPPPRTRTPLLPQAPGLSGFPCPCPLGRVQPQPEPRVPMRRPSLPSDEGEGNRACHKRLHTPPQAPGSSQPGAQATQPPWREEPVGQEEVWESGAGTHAGQGHAGEAEGRARTASTREARSGLLRVPQDLRQRGVAVVRPGRAEN